MRTCKYRIENFEFCELKEGRCRSRYKRPPRTRLSKGGALTHLLGRHRHQASYPKWAPRASKFRRYRGEMNYPLVLQQSEAPSSVISDSTHPPLGRGGPHT